MRGPQELLLAMLKQWHGTPLWPQLCLFPLQTSAKLLVTRDCVVMFLVAKNLKIQNLKYHAEKT